MQIHTQGLFSVTQLATTPFNPHLNSPITSTLFLNITHSHSLLVLNRFVKEKGYSVSV